MYFQVMKEGMLHVQDIDAIPADQIELLQVTREDTLSVFDLKSFVAVAMRSGEENLGILFVASRKPSVLEEDKQKAIQTLAYQAATCMQLADLAQTREKAAQAEAMNFVNSSAAQFAHRLSNVAGTIPLIVRDLRKKIMEAGVTDDRVLRRFDDLANDTTMLMEMADYLRIPQDIGPLAPVDVQKTIDRAIDKARLTDINSSIRLTCDIQTDLPPVTGCETLVEDILVNLLHNAVEAKAENVQLTASRDPQTWKVVLKVIDDGVGIQESDYSKLFTPFYSTKKASLHGIGLWASRASLTRMNGQLQVQSELNKGTTMTVTLPASDEK
jgi:signal transduction histidine kinase